MSTDNPFAAPSESFKDGPGSDRDGSAGGVSTRTIEILSETRPWVLFIGVLMWIGTVIAGLASVGLVVTGLATQNSPLAAMGAVYMLLALVYGVLARSLTSYASNITLLKETEKLQYLEDALAAQKSFWRLMGIITLVIFCLYIVGFGLLFSGAFMMGNFPRR